MGLLVAFRAAKVGIVPQGFMHIPLRRGSGTRRSLEIVGTPNVAIDGNDVLVKPRAELDLGPGLGHRDSSVADGFRPLRLNAPLQAHQSVLKFIPGCFRNAQLTRYHGLMPGYAKGGKSGELTSIWCE